MNLFFSIVYLLLLSPTEGATSFYIRPDSRIEVHGSSNVTDFTCEIDGSDFADTIAVRFQEVDAAVKFSNFSLFIPIEKIGCGNRIMTKDMKRTLEEKQHPRLNIQFLEYVPTGELMEGKWVGELHSRFIIAGKQKEYWHNVLISYVGDRTLLEGNIPIEMNEFGLEPKASVPLVKVAEQIDIQFYFAFDHLEK